MATITTNYNSGSSANIGNIGNTTVPRILLTNTTTTNASTNKTLVYTESGTTNNIVFNNNDRVTRFIAPLGNSIITIAGGATNVLATTTNNQTWQNKNIMASNNNTVNTTIISGLTTQTAVPAANTVCRINSTGIYNTTYYPPSVGFWQFNRLFATGTVVANVAGYQLRQININAIVTGPANISQPSANIIRFTVSGTYEIFTLSQVCSSVVARAFLRTIAGVNLLESLGSSTMENKTIIIHGTIVISTVPLDCGLFMNYSAVSATGGGSPSNITGSQELYDSVFIRQLA